MKESPASDGLIICVRENDEYMLESSRIPQWNRKIRDQKKARHPQNSNDEEQNQEDHHRFLPAFSIQRRLKHQWNDAPGVTHVRDIRLADSLHERLLFNMY